MKFSTTILLIAAANLAAASAAAQQGKQPPPQHGHEHEHQVPPPGLGPEGPQSRKKTDELDGRMPGMPKKNVEVPRFKTGLPNKWFTFTRLFMGEYTKTSMVKGKFKFKSPHGTDVVTRLSEFEPHCQCVKAIIKIGDREYHLDKGPKGNILNRMTTKDGKKIKQQVQGINVTGGQEGTIEVHMTLGEGFQGVKESSLQFNTDDKKMPLVNLKFQAYGKKYFDVSPGDFFLNEVGYEDSKKYRFRIYSDIKPDFKLLEQGKVPAYVTVKKEQKTLPNGKKGWEVTGTFGPKAPANSGGATITFKTDLEGREVKLNLIANVTGPIEIAPGKFISLGRIKKSVGVEKKVQIYSKMKGNFDLNVTEYEFQDLTIDKKHLEFTWEKTRDALTLKLKVRPGVTGRILMKGSVLVSFNHPAVGKQKFEFNGILRR